jgi:hypothetical protein
MEDEWTPQLTPAGHFAARPADDLGRGLHARPARRRWADSYVLGEINVSSIFPMPDEAPAEIARRVANRLRSKL